MPVPMNGQGGVSGSLGNTSQPNPFEAPAGADASAQKPGIIPKNLQDALKDLRNAFLKEQVQEEFALIRKVSRSRDLYAGKTPAWFNQHSLRWQNAESALNYNKETAPSFKNSLNFHQAVGLILISAVASTGIPGTAFAPANIDNPQDVAWAKQAKAIVDLLRTQQDYYEKWLQLWRLFYTDGVVLGYSRWVDTSPNEAPGTKGQQKTDYFGLLESRLPNYASTIDDCPYAAIETDLHVASAKAFAAQVNPEIVSKIKGGSTGSGGSELVPMSQARQLAESASGFSGLKSLQYGTPVRESLCVYRRWWFSADSFMAECIKADSDRKELQGMFPEGARVEWINDEFCTGYPEDMKRHLRIGRCLPGDGMFTPSMGESVVSVHEAANDAWAVLNEAMEMSSFAPVLVNASMLTRESFGGRMKPRDVRFVKPRGGQKLSDAIWQAQIKESSQTVTQLLDSWGHLTEFLAGSQPALFGGSQENIRTNSGYQTARNQALQRLGVPFQYAKAFISAMDDIAVQQFIEHAPHGQTESIVGESSEGYIPANINLDLPEGKFVAYPESSETIPATWAQKQGNLDQMIESQNPIIQAWIGNPENLELVAESKAMPQLKFPGREAKQKILELIPVLLKSANVPGPADPQTGQPGPPILPFEPNQVLDNLPVYLKTLQDWSAEPAGRQAQLQNPAGYAQVAAFAAQVQGMMKPPAPPPEPKDIVIPLGASVIEQSTQEVVFPKPGMRPPAEEVLASRPKPISSGNPSPASSPAEGGNSQGATQ